MSSIANGGSGPDRAAFDPVSVAVCPAAPSSQPTEPVVEGTESPEASGPPRLTDVASLVHMVCNPALLVAGDGCIVAANVPVERLFGYESGGLIGQSVEVLLPAALRERHREQRRDFAAAGGQRHLGAGPGLVALRSDGTTIPVEAGLSTIRTVEGSFVLALMADVTGRQAMVRALTESETRFRQLAENIREVFWLAEPNQGRVIYVSPAYETIWGRSCADLYRSPSDWLEAAHPEDRDRVMQALREADGSGSFDVEYRIIRPGGAVRWIRDQGFPVRDAGGTIVRIAGVAEDVTERRHLLTQLHQTQKMETVGQLAGGVAHDFNNWLTVISGNSELLLSTGELDAAGHELIGEIREATQRAASLTRQLLAFSRQHLVEPRLLDLNAVVADTEKMLRRLLGEDVVLDAELDPGLHRIRADTGNLAQVLVNLAVNARDAMPRGGRLTLRTANIELDADYARLHPGVRSGPHVLLAVSDTGSGMDAAVLSHVFEPFFTTKGVGRGTGLGLAVVHGIVEQSGGHLEVESAPGAGTTFSIFLPATTDLAPPAVQRSTGDAMRGAETVLVVEDEYGVRRVAERGLSSRGYKVLSADGGRAALRILEECGGAIDLLVTDVVMPEMDGRELAESVRARYPHVRVLFTSGYTDDAIVRRGVFQAEVAFLQKPYTPRLLRRKIREVLDGAPSA